MGGVLLFEVLIALLFCYVLGESPPMITFSELKVRVKDGNSRYKEVLTIEHEGAVYSGRLLGILGPSGAGKSTFLNLLSGRMRQSSSIATALSAETVVGSDISPALRGEEIAFIHQDDTFFSMLSVMETLDFASQLRLPAENTHTKTSAIEESIASMALLNVRNSAVGDPLGKRGISGGERKRLSVACELLSKPKLLIADEPTSGLDSYQALSVVQQIKRAVVDRNIIGVTTLHQPRSSIFALIDDLLVLAPGGRVVYHGERDKLLSYLQKQGYPCPSNTNPAEHIIDLVSIDYTSSDAAADSVARIDRLTEAFHRASQTATRSSGIQTYSVSPEDGAQSSGKVEVIRSPSIFRGMRAVSRSVSRFGMLFKRALRQTLRDSGTNFVRFGVSAFLASVVGSLYGRQGAEIKESSVGDRVTIIAQAAINVGMLTMIKTLQLFKKEKSVVGREMTTGQYFSFEYLLAKLLAELPMDAAVAALFGVVVHRKTELSSSVLDFVSVLALLGCACSSLGLAVGALSPSGDVALAVGPALMVVNVILGAVGPTMGGASSEPLPAYLRTVQSFSPIRPACESMCFAEFAGRKFAKSDKQGLRAKLAIVPKIFQAVLGGRNAAEGKVEGDFVLEDLGMLPQELSFASARGGLVRMLVVHSALALVGLVFSNHD